MPKVNVVKKARKDYPQAGIKKGDTYYWWSFRFGGTHMSKTYPKPSQLTQSDFLQRVYDINERLGIFSSNIEDIESDRDSFVSELEELRDECEEKRSNMPEQLQESSSGEILQNRYDALDDMINELQSVDLDFDDEPDEPSREDFDEGEDGDKEFEDAKEEYQNIITGREEKLHTAIEEIQAIGYSGE